MEKPKKKRDWYGVPSVIKDLRKRQSTIKKASEGSSKKKGKK